MLLVDTYNEGKAEQEKQTTVGHQPDPLVVLKIGELGHDHHGEDSHDAPLSVADTQEDSDVGLFFFGGWTAGLRARAKLRMKFGGHCSHDLEEFLS